MMDILEIFYNNIIVEAMNGRINCLSYYNMAFSTEIVDKGEIYSCNIDDDGLLIPTLMIKNKSEFDRLLVEYVDLAMNFYDDSNFDDEILNYKLYDNNLRICREKVILSLLFANATIEDFNNPIDFLKRRIDFMYNDLSGNYDFGYMDMFKGNLSLNIEKDIINNETPYQMIFKVTSMNGEEFIFPKIKFGISDGCVYIYAIQNKMNEDNSFCKKINRGLYKVGEGYVDTESYEGEENLKDVTASFLVSLNMAISYLYNNGYERIVVPSLLVERWNAKRISNLLKIKMKKMDDDSAKEMINNQDYLQHNLTNKLIRTFLRLGCHYNNMDVLSFPFELDSCLYMEINDRDLECNNSLLYKTYNLIEDGISKNRDGMLR